MHSHRHSPSSARPRTSRTRFLLAVLGTALATVTTLVGTVAAQASVPHNPIGSFDGLSFSDGYVRARGWTIDPDTTASIKVRFTIDGRTVDVLANRPRADIGTRYPKYGPYHGFSLSVKKANGPHTFCVTALNVSAGSNTSLGCRVIHVNNSPDGATTAFELTPGGVHIRGWAIDPNTASPITVQVRLDGQLIASPTASQNLGAVPTKLVGHYGNGHWFDLNHAITDGTHTLCVTAVNVGLGANTAFACRNLATTHNPIGVITAARRASSTSTTVTVTGWTLDPDTADPISAIVSAEGTAKPVTTAANLSSAAAAAAYPNFGSAHGFTATITVDAYQRQVCVSGANVQAGSSTPFACTSVPSTGDTTPAAVTTLQTWPGNTRVDLSWTAPRSINATITGYTVTQQPGGATVKVGGSATTAAFTGLTNNVRYSYTIVAANSFGAGSASAPVTATPSPIPPQFTPAPVSTSHYPRNWTGNATTDAAMLKKMGATDASYNPSGHRYLILMDIGGQDQSRGGVLLSATSKFFTYAYTVKMMQAYLDGYHSAQKVYAPLVLAVGTNNDVDVSSSAGASWANSVIDPLMAYVTRYPNMSVAGANDIEPGFSATVSASRAWVSGYLANTTAKYVFNGSADGCSTTTAGTRCNNGWTMADLQWVGGGASPSRTIALPQIYNTAMPLQWKYISLTGISLKKPKLYFGGPLTEWTACDQAGSCYSAPNVNSWNNLWNAISSNAATKQYDMPYGTDLKIN